MASKRQYTRKALSDDQKQARMEVWAAKLGLSKEIVTNLKNNFGPYAYEIMQKAMTHPTELLQQAGLSHKSSKETIKYLSENKLDYKTIAKITNTPEKDIIAAISEERFNTTVNQKSQPNKNKNIAKQKAEEATKKLDQKVDNKKKAQTKPLRQNQADSQNLTIYPTAWTEKNPTASSLTPPWATKKQNSDTQTITPDSVMIYPSISRQGSYNELKSVASYNGKPIKEPVDSTQYSIFNVTHIREVGTQSNPVGARSSNGLYYGAMQHNKEGVKNIAIYALLHPEKYGDFANKIFNTKAPGFQKALEEFKKEVAKSGKEPYRLGSPSRAALSKYLKSNFLTTFVNEGKSNSQKMLQLQRDAASEVTAAFYNMKGIAKVLKQKGIKPQDVNPAVWSMVIATGIARGNIEGMSKLFVGKTIKQINSPQMIDAIAKKYPGVFNRHANERVSVQWAREHVNEKHSTTTLYELSNILEDPSIYENYLAKVDKKYKIDQENSVTKLAKGGSVIAKPKVPDIQSLSITTRS